MRGGVDGYAWTTCIWVPRGDTGIGSKQQGGSQPEGRARESRSCDSAQWEMGVPLSLEVGGEAQHLSSTHISILCVGGSSSGI